VVEVIQAKSMTNPPALVKVVRYDETRRPFLLDHGRVMRRIAPRMEGM
jgi:hypothetical protein